jgi:hypothetical protein
MRRVRKAVVGLLFSMSLAGTAWAGLKSNSPVYISTSGMYANGSLGSARNSSDALQYIGCYTRSDAMAASTLVCYARDSDGVAVSCSTTVASMIAVAQGLNSDSHLWFSWDSTGECNRLDVYNVSQTPPKVP